MSGCKGEKSIENPGIIQQQTHPELNLPPIQHFSDIQYINEQ